VSKEWTPEDRAEQAEAKLAKVAAAARAYEADPINSFDRPESWMKLDALLAAAKEER